MKKRLLKVVTPRLLYEYFRYGIVGIATTVISITLFMVLDTFGNIHYQVANLIANLVSVTFAFLANKHYVFKSKGSIKKEGSKFFIVRFLSVGVDHLLMFFFVTLISLDSKPSKVIVNILIVFINYFFSKFFIFRSKPEEEEQHSLTALQ